VNDELFDPEDVVDQLAYSRAIGLGIASAIAALLLALYAHAITPDPTFVPLLSSEARVYYVLALLLAAGIGAFAQYTDRDAPDARNAALQLGFRWIADQARASAWILPTLASGGVFLMAAVYHRWPVVVAAPLMAGSGVFVASYARHYAFDPDVDTRRTARIALLVTTYLTGFLTLSLLYVFRMRTLLAAPAIGVAAGLLVLAALDGLDAPLRHRIAAAVVCGVIMAEATWPLNYWNAPGWYGGVVLAAFVIALATAVAARFEERIDRSLVGRLAGIAALVVTVVAFVADQPL
jgi:Protein of unknown function (DUF5656)